MEFRYIVALLGLKDEFIDMVVKESPRWAEKRVVTVEKRAGCSLFVFFFFFLPLIPPKRKKKVSPFILLSVALSDNGAGPQPSELSSPPPPSVTSCSENFLVVAVHKAKF